MKIDIDKGIISVQGAVKLSVLPDNIKIHIGIQHTAKTIKEAQMEVNKNIKMLLDLFKKYKIENVQTHILNFSPNYEWKEKKHVLIGQNVEQGLIVTINDLDKNIQKAKDLIDKITMDIKSMYFRISFGINDHKKILKQARDLAYKNALEKAKQYAKLANLEIIKIIKISEFEPRDVDYDYYSSNERASPLMLGGSSTELPVGLIDIEAKLFCDFLVK